MKNIIQFTISKDTDGYFTASAADHFIVTQGETFDELQENIREAVELYIEDMDDLELVATPAVIANFEIPLTTYA